MRLLFDVARDGENEQTRSCRGLSRRACNFVTGCVLASTVLLVGCKTIWTNEPPPCPVPPAQAIDEAFDAEGDELERYLGEIERYCDAIEELRS